MKKLLVALVVFIALIAGYLVYDWISVSNKRANAPIVHIYSWKTADGSVHFSDNPPPAGAVDVHKTRGQAYVAPPLAIRIKETVSGWFDMAKERISKRNEGRSGKKSKR